MSNKNKNQNKEEVFLDQTLRPTEWDEYVGQKHVNDNLRILLSAAAERGEPAEHVLFYGPPRLGKTTLAHFLAREANKPIRITSGPAVERVGDLASILTNLSPGDILFIDEVHRLPKTVEEILYPAMESGKLDIIIGKGPSARTIQLDLPPFTLIAATTRVAMISSPLRSRFGGGVFRLEFYTEKELEKILERSARLLNTHLEKGAVEEIARRSRFTPRAANFLLKRCRDFAQVEKRVIDHNTVRVALEMLQIDELGLSAADRKFLEILMRKFGGGPVGLKTKAAATSEEEATLEEVVEPYLIQLGLLERTPRGRVATTLAFKHLNIEPPKNLQNKLIS